LHPTKQREKFAPIDFKQRFPALDGIRALAVLMVFADHFGGGAHGGKILQLVNEIRGYGWVGVDIFFVLSGFLITGILYDTRHDSRFFQRFFARRSLRIFPVFYLVVAVCLALTPIFHYVWRPGHLLFLFYMGNFLANHDFSYYMINSRNHAPAANIFIGHFWSLCVEEQFYLLWPIGVWLLRDRVKILWTATALCVLALALRFVMVFTLNLSVAETWIVRTLPFRMDALLFGGILALLLRGPNADRWQRACLPLFVFGAGGFVALCVIRPPHFYLLLLSMGLTLTAFAGTGLIGLTLPSGSPAFRLFYRKPLRVLGKYSYGFYIYHVLFGNAWIALLVFLEHRLHSLSMAGFIMIPSALVVTFFVSKLSFDLFEVKFLRWKRHFEYDSELVEHQHAFITK